MSSVLNQSSTTDAQDVESTYDRYNVTGILRNKDGEESNANKSVSFGHLSAASSSFDSRTYGTSYVSDGSETLERDEFLDDEEFLDLDNLSLESQPMVMDRFVDSACSCLDQPAVFYQRMCLGTETSLLRQSKVRSPTNFQNKPTSPNLGMAAAKRRTHLLRGKNTDSYGEIVGAEPVKEDEKRNEIQIMRIQPEDVSKFKDVVRPTTQNHNNEMRRKDNEKKTVPSDSPLTENTTRHQTAPINESYLEDTHERKGIDQNKEANKESPSISNGSTKSMVERAIQKVTKEDEERSMHVSPLETVKDTDDDGLLEIAGSVDADVKIDPPSDINAVTMNDGQSTGSCPANLPGLESSRSDEVTTSISKENKKLTEVAMDPSGRGQRTQSPTVTTRRATKVVSQECSVPSRTKEIQIASDDDTSLFNDLEVIDVLSMDDQDSWIPGNRNEIDNPISRNKEELHHHRQNSTWPASNLSLTSTNNKIQGDRLVIANSSGVDELWVEEEEKLNSNNPSHGAKSSRSNARIATQTADNLWNEERMKLQATKNIFDDAKEIQALSRQDQGNRRDTISDAREILRSQSRRQRIRKTMKDRDIEDFSTYTMSHEKLRLLNLGRSPPSPENLPAIQQSQNDSLERSMAGKTVAYQQSVMELSNITPLPSRKKDLVAVRSIEEGQRIRSSKRNAPKRYNSHSHHKSSVEVNSYAKEMTSKGPYDEQSKPSRLQTKSNPAIKSSSRQISKTRDPNGRKRLTNFEEQANKYELNDERDDQESLPFSNPIEVKTSSTTSEKKLTDYEIAISATKELRKLEKKIERQLRRADLDSKTDQSKEIRRIEKKLSKKLRSIRPDDMDGQAVSSREIRRLEKQLAQKLSGENENRASKLKRIKRKGASSARSFPSLSMKFKAENELLAQKRSSYSGHNDFQQTQDYVIPPAPPSKSFSDDSGENLPERHRHDNPKVLRSRYVKRGMRRKMYTKVTDSD
mmetsp:Transcript_15787/g.36551  ORF Transcript_15787/g.36551 Transcript_15787/m.36551 type:complete len:976 (+) Transcript_15787:185-3112(+)|eukprot:CAMPEP_0197186398 /NCGR_PEP_ID=MMETSP1423-20130617/13834_1 /TAXON_ID=476441 /ORGANISM="Pseudo-nitzschia heimii, Strain UNC1101" /LENGTH=975 /DNA_ID=CAMNT_0042637701 /DNA_START=158 /DNA_END=3085 /DNA_ORIENTATION=+